MASTQGALARTLDFGDTVTTTAAGPRGSGLRLAAPLAIVSGPDKYKVLEHRRRQAQIRARRQLDLLDRSPDLYETAAEGGR